MIAVSPRQYNDEHRFYQVQGYCMLCIDKRDKESDINTINSGLTVFFPKLPDSVFGNLIRLNKASSVSVFSRLQWWLHNPPKRARKKKKEKKNQPLVFSIKWNHWLILWQTVNFLVQRQSLDKSVKRPERSETSDPCRYKSARLRIQNV